MERLVVRAGDEQQDAPERTTGEDAGMHRVLRWFKSVGDEVIAGDELVMLESLPGNARRLLRCPKSATLRATRVQMGQSVPTGTLLAELEYCPHAVVFAGLCTVCGRDVSVGHFAQDGIGSPRLSVAYAQTDLSVTHAEAQRTEVTRAKELLQRRKLSLVLDLDHTLLHATDDERAEAALLDDRTPPTPGTPRVATPRHHRGVHSFVLDGRGSPLYVKLRPGLGNFLRRVSDKYELHIYTMGTRAYADAIATILDPQRQLFRDRITSREEFPEGSLNQKSLQRVFPCDDHMVLIVDDREDVWLDRSRDGWSAAPPTSRELPNLLRVQPYHFFSGLHEAYDRRTAAGGATAAGGENNAPSAERERAAAAAAAEATRRRPATPPARSPPPPVPILEAVGRVADEADTPAGAADILESAPELTVTEIGPDEPLSAHGEESRAAVGAAVGADDDEGAAAKTAARGGKAAADSDPAKAVVVAPRLDLSRLSYEDEENPPLADASVQAKADTAGEDDSTKADAEAADGGAASDATKSPSSPPSTPKIEGEGGAMTEAMKQLVQQWWSADLSEAHQLRRLATVLELVHQRFFEISNATDQPANGAGAPPPLSPHSPYHPHVWKPPADVKSILTELRLSTLRGCVLAFTGVFPPGQPPEHAELWRLALRFGACCVSELHPGVTHLVVHPQRGLRTEKARLARQQHDGVFCVTLGWLEDSAAGFQRASEQYYSAFPLRPELAAMPLEQFRHRHAARIALQQRMTEMNADGTLAAKVVVKCGGERIGGGDAADADAESRKRRRDGPPSAEQPRDADARGLDDAAATSAAEVTAAQE